MVLVSIVKQTSSRPGDSGLKEDRSCCGEVPSGRGVMVSGTSGFGQRRHLLLHLALALARGLLEDLVIVRRFELRREEVDGAHVHRAVGELLQDHRIPTRVARHLDAAEGLVLGELEDLATVREGRGVAELEV
jgi:hypothetical protein